MYECISMCVGLYEPVCMSAYVCVFECIFANKRICTLVYVFICA